VWVLFLNIDGTVKSHRRITGMEAGFTATLEDGDSFGRSVAGVGDLDGDGVGDLAVGATGDDDGGYDHGAVWILFLKPDGTVKSHRKISDTEGGFTGILDLVDAFGEVASLGDLDGNGVTDLAVGSVLDDDGGRDRGAVWVLFLDGVGSDDGQSVVDRSNSGACGSGMCGAMGMLCLPLTMLSLMAMRRRRVRRELRD